ncbi:hypothetical protein Syun_013459 [Stephania yunnanensis]|uniref:Uncharacterized protein n=1 Tax=Stephania yunnanensis TaxID=152371 RepID=A0AAP0JHL6_9MAGN
MAPISFEVCILLDVSFSISVLFFCMIKMHNSCCKIEVCIKLVSAYVILF